MVAAAAAVVISKAAVRRTGWQRAAPPLLRARRMVGDDTAGGSGEQSGGHRPQHEDAFEQPRVEAQSRPTSSVNALQCHWWEQPRSSLPHQAKYDRGGSDPLERGLLCATPERRWGAPCHGAEGVSCMADTDFTHRDGTITSRLPGYGVVQYGRVGGGRRKQCLCKSSTPACHSHSSAVGGAGTPSSHDTRDPRLPVRPSGRCRWLLLLRLLVPVARYPNARWWAGGGDRKTWRVPHLPLERGSQYARRPRDSQHAPNRAARSSEMSHRKEALIHEA